MVTYKQDISCVIYKLNAINYTNLFFRYTHFVQNAGLRDEVCMVVANSFDSDDTSSSKYDKLGIACFFIAYIICTSKMQPTKLNCVCVCLRANNTLY